MKFFLLLSIFASILAMTEARCQQNRIPLPTPSTYLAAEIQNVFVIRYAHAVAITTSPQFEFTVDYGKAIRSNPIGFPVMNFGTGIQNTYGSNSLTIPIYGRMIVPFRRDIGWDPLWSGTLGMLVPIQNNGDALGKVGFFAEAALGITIYDNPEFWPIFEVAYRFTMTGQDVYQPLHQIIFRAGLGFGFGSL